MRLSACGFCAFLWLQMGDSKYRFLLLLKEREKIESRPANITVWLVKYIRLLTQEPKKKNVGRVVSLNVTFHNSSITTLSLDRMHLLEQVYQSKHLGTATSVVFVPINSNLVWNFAALVSKCAVIKSFSNILYHPAKRLDLWASRRSSLCSFSEICISTSQLIKCLSEDFRVLIKYIFYLIFSTSRMHSGIISDNKHRSVRKITKFRPNIFFGVEVGRRNVRLTLACCSSDEQLFSVEPAFALPSQASSAQRII